MKFISWNVNGIRCMCRRKGFMDFFFRRRTQTFSAFRRRRCRKDSLNWTHRDIISTGIMRRKKGYSGDSNIYQAGTNQRKLRTWNRGARPGRACDHVEFEDFYFITVYTPNSQSELARLDYRMKWEREDFLTYLKKLEETKPVIFCGDLNVAHTEIDLKNPKTNRKNAGFTR